MNRHEQILVFRDAMVSSAMITLLVMYFIGMRRINRLYNTIVRCMNPSEEDPLCVIGDIVYYDTALDFSSETSELPFLTLTDPPVDSPLENSETNEDLTTPVTLYDMHRHFRGLQSVLREMTRSSDSLLF